MDHRKMHHAAPDGNIPPEILDLARALAAVLRPAPARRAAVYRAHPLPPGSRQRIFAERCRSIPAARREGRGWVVSAEAWEAARSARPVAPPADDPETLLAGAGVRLRRGAR